MKYLSLMPIIGIFAPMFLKDWERFTETNLFSIALVIQIISLSLLTVLCK